MSTQNWSSKEVLNPRGSWTSGALTRKGNPSRASVSQNMRYSPGTASSREGTSVVMDAAGPVKSMHNWLSPSANHLIYLEGSTVKRRRISDGDTATLATGLTTTQALSCAEAGPSLYFCGFTSALAGSTQARVWDGATAVDTCFRGPLQVTSMTATDAGSGECTKGTHYIGFVFQSRSGFAGKPSPVNGSSVFTPASVTLNAQQRTIQVSITMNTPADAGDDAVLYPIMTRASNPNTYYWVLDQSYAVPASQTGWNLVFTISVSDEDLAAKASEATDQFNLLTQAADGTGPFSPNWVAPYGKRMVYGVGNKAYHSEIDDHQAITEDFNVRQTPGQRGITAGAQLGLDFYYFGDRWTARDSDNGDVPATWATVSHVSGAVGSIAPQVEYGKDNEWLWVASSRGLELFTGKYDEHPISFYQSDIWARVNQAAASCIQIADDVSGLKVHVAVPLDGATSPTHDLVYDYTQGKTFESIDFSLDAYAASTFSAIRAVKEANGKTAVYIGPSAAGKVVKLDPSTHDDVSLATGAATAINAMWESGYVRKPGEIQRYYIRVGNLHTWARGSGALAVRVFGNDRVVGIAPADLTLASSPGISLFSKFDLNPTENYTVRYWTNAIGSWFQLSGFTPYYRPSLAVASTAGGSSGGGSSSWSPSTGSTQDWGDAAPTTGTYVQGSIRWAYHPVAGGAIGWVCVASGTPGTWESWGSISE